MKSSFGCCGALFTILAIVFSSGSVYGEDIRITPVVRAVQETKAAVVNVSTYEKVKGRVNPFSGYTGDPYFDRFFDDFTDPRYENKSIRTSLGSGVIIDKNGYLITNWHVVQNSSTIKVATLDEKEYDALLIGSDPKSDLAILKIRSSQPFPCVKIGDSDNLLIGETVIAIGNPFGLSNTVTTGVVSALHRSIKKDDEQYENFIQTDASINPGNSGGPLLNIKGELIGINTAIYGEAQGIGFAIPVNTAKRIINDLLRYGEVRSPWLGIYVQNLNRKIAQQFSYPGKHGVMITTVLPASPAYKAGLKRGDIITTIDQQPVKSKESFTTMLYSYTADNTIALSVFRDSSQKEYAIKAIAFPVSLVDEVCWKVMGIAVMENNAAIAKKYGLYADQGVVIKSTQDNGQAEQRGLKPGDIMLQINENEIKNMEDFKKNIARNAQRETILILIQRGPYGYYLNLEMVP